jgi:propanol-preferring alcohol dehydrogenase
MGRRRRPPRRLDAAIVFAPAGALVPMALEALDRGGIFALAGIHMSEIPPLDYERRLLIGRSTTILRGREAALCWASEPDGLNPSRHSPTSRAGNK